MRRVRRGGCRRGQAGEGGGGGGGGGRRRREEEEEEGEGGRRRRNRFKTHLDAVCGCALVPVSADILGPRGMHQPWSLLKADIGLHLVPVVHSRQHAPQLAACLRPRPKAIGCGLLVATRAFGNRSHALKAFWSENLPPPPPRGSLRVTAENSARSHCPRKAAARARESYTSISPKQFTFSRLGCITRVAVLDLQGTFHPLLTSRMAALARTGSKLAALEPAPPLVVFSPPPPPPPPPPSSRQTATPAATSASTSRSL